MVPDSLNRGYVDSERFHQGGEAYLKVGSPQTRWSDDAIEPDGNRAPGLMQISLDRLRVTRAAVHEEAGTGCRLEALPVSTEPIGGLPQSTIKIVDFVEHAFVPEHVALKKLAGRIHYQAILKHVLAPEDADRAFKIDVEKSRTRLKAVQSWPYLGEMRLCDARPDDVEQLVAAALARGYSTQTVMHIRNTVRAIFEHAKKTRCFTGDNPAAKVRVPEMIRKEAHALTLSQAEEVLGVMQYPEKEVALIAILTGMNVAEICGLQWKCVNMTDAWSNKDGDPIPPRTIAVRKQWHSGELDRLARRSRTRNLPIPEQMIPVLMGLSHRASFVEPDDFVLVTRAGKPIGAKQIAAHRLKVIGKNLRMPWLSWHVFHRTHTALAYQFGMQFLGRLDLTRCPDSGVNSPLVNRETAAESYLHAGRAPGVGMASNPLRAASQ